MNSKLSQIIKSFVKNIGACALVAIMLTVSISVAGRHLGIPVPGSIEIAELLIVVVASASFIYATLKNKHASANFFVEHVSIQTRRYLVRLQSVFSTILGIALCIGNFWLIIDVWYLHEVSFLLEIPIVPFRIIWLCATFIVTVRLFLHLISPNTEVSGDIEF